MKLFSFLFFFTLIVIVTFCESLTLFQDIARKAKHHGGSQIASLSCKTSSSLMGEWKNNLKSLMNITNVYEDPDNVYNNYFTGTYESGVGNADGVYPLHGTFNYRNCSTSISFSVIYSNSIVDSGSNTAWVGQLRCVDQTLVLEMTWIMNKYMPNDSIWESTWTGHDIFHKNEYNACSFMTQKNANKVGHHNSAFQEKAESWKTNIKKKAETIVLF